MNPQTPPIVNGKTFAQASQGITDRGQLGALAQQYQTAVQPKINPAIVGAQPKVIPPPPVNNTAASNLTTATDLAIAGNQPQPVQDTTSRTGLQNTFNSLTDFLGTKSARTNAISDEQGLTAKNQALKALQTDAVAIDQSFQRQINAIKGNGALTKEQASAQIQELQAQNQSRKADIAINTLVAQGDYNSALEAVKLKVDAEFAPAETKLKYFGDQVALFQNDMTESEKLKANQAFQEKQDALDFKRQKELISYRNAIDNASSGGSTAVKSTNYTLKAGDDPWNIAQAAGLDIQALYDANPTIKDWKNIRPGTTIKVPSDNTVPLYSGMKPATATAVRGVVSSFKSEPQVTNFIAVQDGYNFAKSIPNDTKNPTDDQGLIYSLAKVLDPGSVVREGEYATVQKYAQSWVKAYGKKVEQAINGTGFLSPEARKNIKDTIETKYNSTKGTYDNLAGSYATQINNITGSNNGSKFLREYSTPQTSSPQSGQTHVYNGVTYKIVNGVWTPQ